MKPHILIFGLALTSCIAFDETKETSEKSASNGKKPVILAGFDFNLEEKKEVSSASMTNLSYEAASHTLRISLEYKACGILQHELIFSSMCAESYPSQCGAALVHATMSAINCDTIQHEDMKVDLKTDQDEMVLVIATQGGQPSRVLVDRTGRVKEATTPP